MSFFEILLILLFFATVASSISKVINIPIEIFLLLASLVISVIPDHPILRLEPSTLLLLFLPPIIFSAAYFTSWKDFIKNQRPISLLAFGLVLFTMCTVALMLKLLIIDINWPLCFLFGAIISPTDASSAVSLGKKLNIPNRIITIIEGESLINDATALIAYRYSLAAVMLGVWSFWSAGLNFILAAVGGLVFGLTAGFISLNIYLWLREPKVQNIFLLLVPYYIYIAADKLKISAIIALVTAGVYISRKFPSCLSSESRQKAQTIWEVYIFTLNALVFILIGLQLPIVMKGLNSFSVTQLVVDALIINITIILARMIWVYLAAYIPRYMSPSIRLHDPYPHWSELATLGWVGMRGMLSLALAMSVPITLPSGVALPYRSLFIFLTYTVIIVSLLLPTFTLPSLVALFKFKKENRFFQEEAFARIESIKLILHELEVAIKKYPNLQTYIKQLEKRYQNQIAILDSNLQQFPYSKLNTDELKIRELTKNLLKIERNLLIHLRQSGKIHDEVFHQLEKELDLEDLKLKTQRI